MSRECFSLLCQKIICGIGEKAFKSESYINAFLIGKDQMFNAHERTSGGYISGETKVAVSLRLLAGGVIFDISYKHCEKILYDVLLHWIINTGIGLIDMENYLDDLEEMNTMSHGFFETLKWNFERSNRCY